MFDVGFAEIFLLALIGLLVLGPERLPGVARTVGGFVRKARMSWVSLRNTIESELAEADISAPIKKTSEELKQIGRELAEADLSTPIKKTSEELKQIGKKLTEAPAFKSEIPGTDHLKTDNENSETAGPDPVSAEDLKLEPLPEPDSKNPENV